MSPAPRPSRRAPQRAFTLIELLTVMAIILILVGITIPTISGARFSANKAKTRTQFSQWATAFENFKQEYGTYPQFANNANARQVNPTGSSTSAAANHFFHDVLAGKHRDGSPLTGALTGNPPTAIGQNLRRISFISFTDSDLVLQADVTAGRATTAQLNFIRDAFFNTSIGVVTDRDLNGLINNNDAAGGYPTVTTPTAAGGTIFSVRPNTVVTTSNTGGIRAGVIFYSLPPGGTTEADLIMSWR